jgi:hypothetical protein
MTEVADIQVQYVNKPKPGKTWGNIKTPEGVLYWGKLPILNQFTEGETCKVEFDAKDESFLKINKKIGSNGVSPAKQSFRPRMDPVDARGSYITVIQAAYTKAGKIPLESTAIAKAREIIGRGYDMTDHGQQRRDDLQDEIPDWPRSENPAEGIEDTF